MNDIYAIPKTEYEAIDRLEELKEYCMDECYLKMDLVFGPEILWR